MARANLAFIIGENMVVINGTKQLGDFEYQKFREDSTGKPSIAVVNPDGSNIGSAAGGTTYKVKFDTSTTGIAYIGKAAIGTSTGAASWHIAKVDSTSTSDGTITYAAAGAFTATWTNRASETYT